MRLEINDKKINCKNHTHVKAKQYAIKQAVDHWRNRRGNKKIPRDKRKREHDNPKPTGHKTAASL